jgi:hypothetical protein
MPEAYYVPKGRAYQATELTRGPWNPQFQHGGPPAALIGREAARLAGEEQLLARITIEFLRPVPIGAVELQASILRAGKSVKLIGVSLNAAGEEVARATALFMSRRHVDLPVIAPIVRDFPAPADSAPFMFPFFERAVGYHTSVELRLAGGEFGKGPTAVWFRVRPELVAGEPLTPAARALVAADSGNGISLVLDHQKYLFINPELSVHLVRMPEGEWVLLESRTDALSNGVGMSDSRLWDEKGLIGRGCQSLLVDVRR